MQLVVYSRASAKILLVHFGTSETTRQLKGLVSNCEGDIFWIHT